MTALLRVKRACGGWYVVGRRRYVKVAWLRPGVKAIRFGIRQWQVGRLLVRLAWTLKAQQEGRCPRCGT